MNLLASVCWSTIMYQQIGFDAKNQRFQHFSCRNRSVTFCVNPYPGSGVQFHDQLRTERTDKKSII